MEVSGPVNYIREKLLRKTVAGETHEFAAARCLNGIRLNAPSTGVQKFWFGELSLRTGAVSCDRVTKIREYLDDGTAMTRRSLSKRNKDEYIFPREMFIVRRWIGVIRRRPGSLASYQVWIKTLARAARLWLSLRFG